MHTFKVIYTDKEYHKKEYVGVYSTKEEAIDRAYEFLEDKLEGDFDCDTEEDIKTALMERNYYVCGYGESDIEIFEN